jgi:hypothetical protein
VIICRTGLEPSRTALLQYEPKSRTLVRLFAYLR